MAGLDVHGILDVFVNPVVDEIEIGRVLAVRTQIIVDAQALESVAAVVVQVVAVNPHSGDLPGRHTLQIDCVGVGTPIAGVEPRVRHGRPAFPAVVAANLVALNQDIGGDAPDEHGRTGLAVANAHCFARRCGARVRQRDL